MRIVMITGDDLASFRGGTIHLMEQAENLVALGHDVQIIAQDRGAYPQQTTVPIRYLPAWGSGAMRLLSYNVSLLLVLLWLGLRRWPQIIHTRQMGYSATPLFVSTLLRLPHVLEVNGVLRDELSGQSPSKSRLWAIDFFSRLNLHRSDRFTTTTTGYLRRLEQVYDVDEASWRRMPCGVNPDLFRPADQQAARERLQLPEDVFALLHVGSLYDWRGLDVLLEALAQVQGSLPPWALWLVGDGVEMPRLQQQSQDLDLTNRVRFVGQVSYDEVPHWLAAADVGVVLYKSTRPVPGDPMKIYEYMASGLPVMAGDHPHYGGIVSEAAAGVVVDDTDPKALAEAVTRLAADREARRQMGSRGVDVARTQYSWARRAEDLERLFLELLPAESQETT